MIWTDRCRASMGKPRCRHTLQISDVKQVWRGRGALGDGLGFRHNSMVFRHSALLKRKRKKSIPHQRLCGKHSPFDKMKLLCSKPNFPSKNPQLERHLQLALATGSKPEIKSNCSLLDAQAYRGSSRAGWLQHNSLINDLKREKEGAEACRGAQGGFGQAWGARRLR